jgi:hypothetical protein
VNIEENLSSNDNFTYYKAIECILNLTSNHQSRFRAASMKSKPQHVAKLMCLLNGKKPQMMKTESVSSSNSGGKSVTAIESTP